MKCLMLTWRLESGQFSHKIFCFIHLWLNLCIYTCIVYLQPFCVTLDFKLFIDSIHILFLLYLLLWFWDFTIKNRQDFIKIYRALIKDIFLSLEPEPEPEHASASKKAKTRAENSSSMEETR